MTQTPQMQQFMNWPENEHRQANHKSQPIRNSFKIARAKSPIIIISEKSTESWGRMSKYLADTIPNTPVVFETEKAKKIFMNVAGLERRYFEHVTLGILKIDRDSRARGAEQLNQSDCIIVLGSVSDTIKKQLESFETVMFKESKASPESISQRDFNLAVVSAITKRRGIFRDSSWLKRTKSMRPSCMGGIISFP